MSHCPLGRDGSPCDGADLSDRRAWSRLYAGLRSRARALLLRERNANTLQPTVLVHEAWLRLFRNGSQRWENDRHLAGAAIEAMRRILIEHARQHAALRRGGGMARIPLDDTVGVDSGSAPSLLVLDRALAKLEQAHPRKAEVVKLRFLVGLSIEETAVVLAISVGTVKNDWTFARAWITDDMEKSARQVLP